MFTSAAAPECAAAFRFVSSSLSHCCSPGQNPADDKKKHTEEGRKQNETIRYPQKSEQEVLQHMLKGRKSPAEHCSARYQESHRAQKQNADTVSNPHKQPGDHRTQASQKECPEEKRRIMQTPISAVQKSESRQERKYSLRVRWKDSIMENSAMRENALAKREKRGASSEKTDPRLVYIWMPSLCSPGI